MQNSLLLLGILEQALGTPYKLKGGEYAYYCPKCNHHKKKLQVNINSGKSHCWTCNLGAYNIPQLLRKINASHQLIKEALKLSGDYKSYKRDKEEKTKWNITLPDHFQPLWKKSDDIVYKHAMNYLNSRDIGLKEIVRYGIGYCNNGPYANRIIVPSYDVNGKLNYYIARDIFPDSKMKYKNPPCQKNVVIFELFVNWNKPLVIVEGSFDAIAVKKNAIPLLGKFPQKELVKRIVTEKVKEIYIALDRDARKDAIKLSELFRGFGIKTYIVDIDEKDPSDLGFHGFWKIANQATETTFSDVIKGRLYG